MLERFSMAATIEKLAALGGSGKFQECDWRIRVRLNWHKKAKSTIRHMLHGERQFTPEETKQIELAHLKHCAETIEANRDENTKLFQSMRRAIAVMEQTDPEFYRPQIEAMLPALLRLGNMAGIASGED